MEEYNHLLFRSWNGEMFLFINCLEKRIKSGENDWMKAIEEDMQTSSDFGPTSSSWSTVKKGVFGFSDSRFSTVN